LTWTPKQLEDAKQALRKLRFVSDEKCRNGSKSQNRRKQNLQKQIDRIELWQKENPEFAVFGSSPSGEGKEGEPEPESTKAFVPFVPFLNP